MKVTTSCLSSSGLSVAQQHERVGLLAKVRSEGSQRRAELLVLQETRELVHVILAHPRQR